MVQVPKKKAVVPAKQSSDLVTEKRQVFEKPKKTTETEEVNKTVQNFSLENELGKLKIPVPLTELIKNPSYKESLVQKRGFFQGGFPRFLLFGDKIRCKGTRRRCIHT